MSKSPKLLPNFTDKSRNKCSSNDINLLKIHVVIIKIYYSMTSMTLGETETSQAVNSSIYVHLMTRFHHSSIITACFHACRLLHWLYPTI